MSVRDEVYATMHGVYQRVVLHVGPATVTLSAAEARSLAQNLVAIVELGERSASKTGSTSGGDAES